MDYDPIDNKDDKPKLYTEEKKEQYVELYFLIFNILQIDITELNIKSFGN